MTSVASLKMEGVENWIFLDVVELFKKPVKLHELKRTTHQELQTVSALTPGNLKTIYSTTRQEAFWLLGACGSSQQQIFA